jgi:uncharacterized protein YodC (DUF2158 family)
MSDKFQAGDMVQLKSGGPIMTVQGYSAAENNMVECFWQIKAKVFPEKHHEDKLVKREAGEIKISSI